MADPFTFTDWADDDMAWDTDTGAPGIGFFGNALQVWSTFQNRPTSVADAAAAFNVDPTRIVQAVEDHPWMDLSGPQDDFARLMIEHDGV